MSESGGASPRHFQEPKIQELPPDVVAKIKSSTSITHLNEVILELIKNSLDANARTIFVTVNFERGGCIVEDDGEGIPPAEFATGGGLGKAHHTSKLQLDEGFYGRRGLFLASLASLSLLTITSHHLNHPTTNSVIFHHSKPVARLVPAPMHQALKFGSHGTSVTVNDLFGNMPVRVKSRALSLQRPDDLDREWDDLKHLLASIILANDKITKLVLSDAGKKRKLAIRPHGRATLRANPNLDRGELDVKRIGSILTQAGLTDFQNLDSWRAVSACLPDLSIKAAISLVPSPSRKVQFISLGINPMSPRNDTNVLYNEINRLFASSEFGTVGSTRKYLTSDPATPLEHSDYKTSANFKGSSKGINKWPAFYLRIETKDSYALCNDSGDNTPESDQSFQRIIDVLVAMVTEFLEQHHLRRRPIRRKRQTDEAYQVAANEQRRNLKRVENAPRPEPSLIGAEETKSFVHSTEEALDQRLKLPSFRNVSSRTPREDLGNWSKIKSGNEEPMTAVSFKRPRRTLALDSSKDIGLSYCALDDRPRNTKDVRAPGQESTSSAELDSRDEVQAGPSQWLEIRSEINGSEESDLTDKFILWTDPHTRETILINSRTGQSVSPNITSHTGSCSLRPQTSSSVQAIRNLNRMRRPDSADSGTQNLWINKFLKQSDNPTFNRSEKPIKRLDSGTSKFACNTTTSETFDCSGDIVGVETARFGNFTGRIWKQSLETAEVIAQVDEKFILAKMRVVSIGNDGERTSGAILTLIDQHAADERCRIEQLFEEFFIGRSSAGELDAPFEVRTIDIQPMQLEVPATEITLLRKYLKFFSIWGIAYDIEQQAASGASLISVKLLPILIAERCRLEPNIVIDLLRAEIWKREENGVGPSISMTHSRQNIGVQANFDSRVDFDRANFGDSRASWVQWMANCPQGIVDLLNSRACRTAVMFNDVLTLEECQNLVSRLAQCVFPFQCAHGRPSMIPVLELQSSNSAEDMHSFFGLRSQACMGASVGNGGDHSLEFLEAYKAWGKT